MPTTYSRSTQYVPHTELIPPNRSPLSLFSDWLTTPDCFPSNVLSLVTFSQQYVGCARMMDASPHACQHQRTQDVTNRCMDSTTRVLDYDVLPLPLSSPPAHHIG